ncbi:hypothetical protein TgHK011_000990 [Trichoderma gracile]|nr:hypothetical protein TgHK011_000990 [Trichoderma gracile]
MQNESAPDDCSTAHWGRVLPLGLGPLPLTFDAPHAVQQRAAGQDVAPKPSSLFLPVNIFFCVRSSKQQSPYWDAPPPK